MDDNGPVELVLVEFPGNEFKGEIVTELVKLVEAGSIGVLDVLLVKKDADGAVQWFEAGDADDSRLAELTGEPAGLLAEEDVHAIADELGSNSSVGMLLFEHRWAARLVGTIRRANGRLIDWAGVPPAAVGELKTLIAKDAGHA